MCLFKENVSIENADDFVNNMSFRCYINAGTMKHESWFILYSTK